MPAPEEKITVVGSGLVGSLLACFLARRGMSVRLFEKLPDMRKESIPAGRSINLAISTRGLSALRKVGLEIEALRHAIPMRGRVMHSVQGELSFQAYGKDESQHINSISRGFLNRMLMDAAEATGLVELRFRHVLKSIDWDAKTLSFEGEAGGSARSERFETLLGTDGGGSLVRREMLAHGRFEFDQQLLGHGYKELNIPPGRRGAPGSPESFQLEKHALHIWPRGFYMLIALPNEDGSFTCTLFLPFEGPVSFQSLKSPADVQALFAEKFPDALRLLPDLTDQFFGNPTGTMGTVKLWPWNLGGDALLLGDAAHALVPFYGQGMNCGFEDCAVLDGLLAGGEVTWESRFQKFADFRKTNADAIADMAVENFVEMRDKVGDPHFLLEKQVEKILLNTFPGEFLSRYTLVSFSNAPYRFAHRVGEIASGIVGELCNGLTRAEAVDLVRAGKLIRQRLVPYLEDNEFGYRAPLS
jgi:kynurenine 3-monooxygenase